MRQFARAKELVRRASCAIANDVEIWSSDNIQFTANKAALSSASPVLRATFANGTVEEHTNEIRMDFKGGALRVVLPMVHSPSVDQVDEKISLSSLLDACALADYWKLCPALHQLMARAIKWRANAATFCPRPNPPSNAGTALWRPPGKPWLARSQPT